VKASRATGCWPAGLDDSWVVLADRMDLADVDERRSSHLAHLRLTSRGRLDGELAIG